MKYFRLTLKDKPFWGYKDQMNPTIFNSFGTVAFRYFIHVLFEIDHSLYPLTDSDIV